MPQRKKTEPVGEPGLWAVDGTTAPDAAGGAPGGLPLKPSDAQAEVRAGNNPARLASVGLDTSLPVYHDIATLRKDALACTRCDLANSRTQVVFGDGPTLAEGERLGVMIIGEAPGEDEDAQGKPFVGRSGRLINDMLVKAGLSRAQVWITNTVKCRPLAPAGSTNSNRPPNAKEIAACRPWWNDEIALLRPRVIVCLGATAAKTVLQDKNFQITKQRGVWQTTPDGVPLLVTYHPSYVLRQQGDALREIRALVEADLATVRAKVDELAAAN